MSAIRGNPESTYSCGVLPPVTLIGQFRYASHCHVIALATLQGGLMAAHLALCQRSANAAGLAARFSQPETSRLGGTAGVYN